MERKEQVGVFQLMLVVLSVYVLVAQAAELAIPMSAATRAILNVADTAICILFLADFFQRLAKAESKFDFLRWGWIDLVSSIPALHVFRWGRVVRIVRVLRALRGLRTVKTLLGVWFENRSQGMLASVGVTAVMLVTFSSIAILHVERDPSANIKTVGDALWWSISTITTIAYGDVFPVTAEGKMIALPLVTMGVALFGVVAAYLTTWFAQPKAAEAHQAASEIHELRSEMSALADEVRKLRLALAAGAR